MNLTKNGITIQVDDAEITRMVLERLGIAYPDNIRGVAIPAIGEEWKGQGGIFAGIQRGRDGAGDYYLIVGPEHESEVKWKPAMDWAASLKVGAFTDWSLHFRPEQALCFANVPELFQPVWYWSQEQLADISSYAWLQHFGYGSQLGNRKDSDFRARAVRRSPIR